jgi:putative CRISPR-associated protein (TIGR02619 family)
MQTTITTIGTSLLANYGWRRGQALPDPVAADAWLRTTDLKGASAETHTWLKLGILDEPERHQLLLVHTNTPDGRFCAERLDAWARGRGISCSLDEIVGLGAAGEARFNIGLAELARKLAQHAESGARSGGVAIAATGGFKAEIAIANLVGALLGAPVHYLYEAFERPVTLEPLPIALNPEALRSGAGAALLDKLAAAETGDGAPALVRRAEIASIVRQDARLELYLETCEIDGEEHAGLNPIGVIARQLLNAPAAEWPPESDAVPESKSKLSRDHHKPNGWEGIVARLARNPYVTSFRYEGGHRGAQSRIEPAQDSDTELVVLIADGGANPPLGLRVSTAARTAAERDLVLRHVKRGVRL